MGKESTIEKLKGGDNYSTWAFAMTNYLAWKKLDKCIKADATKENEDDAPIAEEKDADKLLTAKSMIVLCVETHIYVHIQQCETAIHIWSTLARMYEEKGLSRKISLLRSLISSKLDSENCMESYVNKILNTSNKLSSVGFPIDDEWISAIILAGLTEKYHPFIMGIEANGNCLSKDEIVAKLLDAGGDDNQNTAFLGKQGKGKNTVRKCYNCNSSTHLANECDQKKKKRWNKKKHNKKGEKKSDEYAFMMGLLSVKNDDDWYIDSGASSHMTPNGQWLNELQTKNSQITVANNSKLNVKGKGNAQLKCDDKNISIKEVLHIPDLAVNLLSVYRMVKNGNTVTFNAEGCTIFDAYGEVIAKCREKNGTYKLRVTKENCYLAKRESSANEWHSKLGHLCYKHMCKLRSGGAQGVNFTDDNGSIKNCETCAKAKLARAPFKNATTETKQILELIHTDVNGPMEVESIGGSRFVVTFIDDFTRKVFIYLIRHKSDVFERFLEFKNFIELQTESKIKRVRSDNGTEYTCNRFTELFKRTGIKAERTTPYTPESNGVAERMNRTLKEKAKCLLVEAKLSKRFWGEAMHMACFLINRSPCSKLGNKTPEELWTGKPIDLSTLKAFGTEVMVHIPKEKRRKWDDKSEKMVFVGYDENCTGYRCMNPQTGRLVLSRNVKFIEKLEFGVDFKSDSSSDSDESSSSSSSASGSGSGSDSDTEDEASAPEELPKARQSMQKDNNTDNDNQIKIDDSRVTKRARLGMNLMGLSAEEESVEQMDYAFSVLELKEENDPVSISEIEKRGDRKSWWKAMEEEIASLNENQTWTLVELPRDAKTIKTKWVFKTKFNNDGEIIKHKARLVAKGYTQRYGLDYDQTYAPVVRYSTIRFLVAVAAKQSLNIHQMDAVSAFLQGDIFEKIYLDQPEGMEDGTGRVCKLNRAIYGLKQAGHMWNVKLDAELRKFGLKKSKMDPCVYYNDKIIIAIYVDDFLFFYSNSRDLDQIRTYLCEIFKMKDMGPARGCVGMRITQTNTEIGLDQKTYVKNVLKRFGMEECNPIGTPSEMGEKLRTDCTKSEGINVPYQEAIGSLLYLAQGTRPDISYAVNNASRFNSNHDESHWKAVKRIFRYVRGTIDYSLVYSKGQSDDLHGYSDSDWASEESERKSCTGYLFKVGTGAITWSSGRQKTIALSSTEAEYMALAAAAQEVIWIQQLCQEIKLEINGPTTIFVDNSSAIKLAKSDGYRKRTKHIDLKYHFIREKIGNGIMDVKYCKTELMVADSLTKAVSKEKTIFCANGMGLKNSN